MILRKICIIVIGTFVADNQQILCVLFVLASLIFLTAYHEPFLSNNLLHLELGSLSLAFFTFWVGGLLQMIQPVLMTVVFGVKVWHILLLLSMLLVFFTLHMSLELRNGKKSRCGDGCCENKVSLLLCKT